MIDKKSDLSEPKPKLNVAYASNDSFAMQTGVSMLGLLKNNGDLDICVYILANGISDGNKAKLSGIATGNAELRFIDMSEFLNEKVKKHGIASYADSFDAYSRIWIAEILPEGISKCLYIDGDTAINGSLIELAKMDLAGYSCAMAIDVRTEKFNKKIGLEDGYEFFNSGVIVINIDYWKERNVCDALLKDIMNFPTIYADNPALCRVLKGSIKTLPLAYNATSLLRLFGNKSLYSIAFRSKAPFSTEEELNDAKENPRIMHYTNYYLSGRPWFKDCFDKKGSKVWNAYFAASPWANSFKYKNQNSPLKSACINFLRLLYVILPERLFVILVVKIFEKAARKVFGIGGWLRSTFNHCEENEIKAEVSPPPPTKYSIRNNSTHNI